MILVLILAVAAGLRFWRLGQLSFWYDEVVTMRLAQAPTPRALIDRLMQIDATRAPLHPLLLQGWIRLFGSTEAAARALSVVCGVVTVGLVWWVGRLAFDEADRALGGLAGGSLSAAGLLLPRSQDVCLARDADLPLLGAALLRQEGTSPSGIARSGWPRTRWRSPPCSTRIPWGC